MLRRERKKLMTQTVDAACEATVAHAAPDIPHPNFATKSQSSPTFMTAPMTCVNIASPE